MSYGLRARLALPPGPIAPGEPLCAELTLEGCVEDGDFDAHERFAGSAAGRAESPDPSASHRRTPRLFPFLFGGRGRVDAGGDSGGPEGGGEGGSRPATPTTARAPSRAAGSSVFSPGVSAGEITEVRVDFSGVERVDTTWVSTAYRADDPPLNGDARRPHRLLAKGELRASCAPSGAAGTAAERPGSAAASRTSSLATPGRAPQPGTARSGRRRFLVRVALPRSLPPSYRGQAVRVWYTIGVSAHAPGRPPAACRMPVIVGLPAGGAEPVAAGDGPAADDPAGAGRGASDTGVDLPSPSSAAESTDARSTASPESLADPEELLPSTVRPLEVTCECWEVGAQTSLPAAAARVLQLERTAAARAASAALPLGIERIMDAARGGGSGREPGGAGDVGDGGGGEPSGHAGERGWGGSLTIGEGSGAEYDGPGSEDRPRVAAGAGEGRGAVEAAAAAATPRPPAASFSLRVGECPLATVRVAPPRAGGGVARAPGSVISGLVSFARGPGTAECSALGIALERVERLQAWAGRGAEHWLADAARRSTAPGGAVDPSRLPPPPSPTPSVEEEVLVSTRNVFQVPFDVPIPSDAAPSQDGHLVAVEWRLRFRLSTRTPQGRSEDLQWDLPVVVAA